MTNRKDYLARYSVLNELDRNNILEKLMNPGIYRRYISWAASLKEEELKSDPTFDVCQDCSSGLESFEKIKGFLAKPDTEKEEEAKEEDEVENNESRFVKEIPEVAYDEDEIEKDEVGEDFDMLSLMKEDDYAEDDARGVKISQVIRSATNKSFY